MKEKKEEVLLDVVLMLNSGDFIEITISENKRAEIEKNVKEAIKHSCHPSTWVLIDKDHTIRCDCLIGYYFRPPRRG